MKVCTQQDALRLMLEGSLALAKIEATGMKVNTNHLQSVMISTTNKIKELDEELKKNSLWKQWQRKYGDKTQLGSKEQLGALIFGDLKFPCNELTPTGRYKADENAFADVDLPFVRDYFVLDKQRTLLTKLGNLKRNLVNGRFHPNFNLHTVSTYRSSSGGDRYEDRAGGSDFNIQNVPVRIPEIGNPIRSCFVPENEEWVILEIDYGRIEVHGNYWMSHDPVLGSYLADPDTDMHRDMAMQIFQLEAEDVSKTIRYVAKNQYVFATFYGDWYRSTCQNMWKACDRLKLKRERDGVPLREHLVSKGITKLGPCDGRMAMPDTFERHVREVENDFWGNRFSAHNAWREGWWQQYQKEGGITTHTGFRVNGVMRKNVVYSIPVQGPCFHCLLQSVIWIVDWLQKYKMRSKVIAQIHDSCNLAVHRSELQDVIEACLYFMTKKLPKFWPFIISTLEVEVEVAESSWADKKQWTKKGEIWQPKKKAG